MKRNMPILIFLVLVSLITQSGCWDRRELNDLALVLATGLDVADDGKVEVSVQLIVPKNVGGPQGKGGNGQPSTIVESDKGESIASAISNLQEKFPRQLFWGHNQVIIIGEKLAKKGIRDHLDYFARHPEIRLHAQVFVSKSKAKDILKISPTIENSSAQFLSRLGKMELGLNITVKDLLQMISGESHSAILPEVSVSSNNAGGNQSPSINQIGSAIFKEDKMVGVIDNRTTRGVLWARDEIKKAIITFSPYGSTGTISLKLLRSKTEVEPKIKDGNWSVLLKVKTVDDIVENDTALNVMNPMIVKKLETSAEEKLNKRITSALNLGKNKYKSDIFGFAQWFHIKYPKLWEQNKEQWDKIFPTIEVSFDTNINIERPGESSTPPSYPKHEVINK